MALAFYEIALLRSIWRWRQMRRWGAWPKVGKAGEGLPQIQEMFID
jgi:hypothetical protein